jgi:hypothetical protein
VNAAGRGRCAGPTRLRTRRWRDYRGAGRQPDRRTASAVPPLRDSWRWGFEATPDRLAAAPLGLRLVPSRWAGWWSWPSRLARRRLTGSQLRRPGLRLGRGPRPRLVALIARNGDGPPGRGRDSRRGRGSGLPGHDRGTGARRGASGPRRRSPGGGRKSCSCCRCRRIARRAGLDRRRLPRAHPASDVAPARVLAGAPIARRRAGAWLAMSRGRLRGPACGAAQPLRSLADGLLDRSGLRWERPHRGAALAARSVVAPRWWAVGTAGRRRPPSPAVRPLAAWAALLLGRGASSPLYRVTARRIPSSRWSLRRRRDACYAARGAADGQPPGRDGAPHGGG